MMFEKTENGIRIEDRFYTNAEIILALGLYDRVRYEEIVITTKED